MRALGFLVMALAVLIAVVAVLYNCQHDGKALTLANGMKVPMKCYWTAMASIAAALPLFGLGALHAFSRRKETRQSLGVLGALLGVSVIALPTALIGVCMHPDAFCNLVMKPALILMGILVIALGGVSLALSRRQVEQLA